jgi:hypothetical protein|tara:strand:+ start:213 stop:455 length:243 start_codon:yes stop_codon:yes gene_type:complete
MLHNHENSKFKAEILYKEKWVDFHIIKEDGQPYQLDEITIMSLPKSIKGRYVSNTIGYNPSGWFSEKTVSKNDIRFSEKH